MKFVIPDISQWKIFDYVNIHHVNPLHLIIDKVDGYIDEKNGNKYLILASSDKNKDVYWQNTQNFGMGLNIWLKK